MYAYLLSYLSGMCPQRLQIGILWCYAWRLFCSSFEYKSQAISPCPHTSEMYTVVFNCEKTRLNLSTSCYWKNWKQFIWKKRRFPWRKHHLLPKKLYSKFRHLILFFASANPLQFEDKERVKCISILNQSKQKASIWGRGRKKANVMFPQP